MKKHLRILLLAILVSFLPKLTSQEYHINENFASEEWQAELLRLNPGSDEFGVPINPNATNPNPYSVPVIPEGKNNAAYTNLNSTDLYFGKYLLLGAIEVVPLLPCPDDEDHEVNGIALAFRFQNTNAGRIELPAISDAGNIILHIRNGNSTNPTTIALEKLVDPDQALWEQIHVFDLQNNNAYPDYRDEVLKFNVNSDNEIKLRVINNSADTKRFINLYQIQVEKKPSTGVDNLESKSFQLKGRTILTEKPEKIQIYSMVGVKLFEKFVESEFEIPQSIQKGIYLLKGENHSQKIYLD